MHPPRPMDETHMLAHCARAAQDVDLYGPRALVRVTAEQTEALIAFFVLTGGMAAGQQALDQLAGQAARHTQETPA